MGNICRSASDGSPSPTCSYFLNLRKFSKIGYRDALISASNDGGKTSHILEPGTVAILRHEDVIQELETLCERLESGNAYRGNDFGLYRFNSKIWEDLNPAHSILADPPETHRIARRCIDDVCKPGRNWNDITIFDHATAYLDQEFIEPGTTFKIPTDIRIWVLIFLHRVMLSLDLSYGEASLFVEMQDNLIKIVPLPEQALRFDCISRKIKLDQVIEFKKQQIQKYKNCLASSIEHLKSEEMLYLVASRYFDVMMLAGGLSVPQVIHHAFAIMYSNHSPKDPNIKINEENLPAFVWETLRFAPPVTCVPYYTTPEKTHRRLINILTASRDQNVWGQDADEFRLRDISEYDDLSVIYAEQMVSKEDPVNNRSCPAKDLSYQMILNFLKAFLRKTNQILVDKSIPDIKMIPKINARGFFLEMSTWEFETQSIFNLSSDELENYFHDVDDHPKFDIIDTNTKYLHKRLVREVVLHHSPEDDGGMRTVGEICLPKPPRDDLKYKTIEAVPGLKIPDDDEDFMDQSELEKFIFEASSEIYFKFLSKLRCKDTPQYFDSKEEAKNVVDKHFYGNILPKDNEPFDDLVSDESISNIAFYGMGQVLLKMSANQDTYEVDSTLLSTLSTRLSYERYGAKAVFGHDMKIIYIFVSSLNRDVYPNDNEWEHAKWVWKVSLITYVTIGPHLVDTHWIISNNADIAARTKLGANHPIRRALKVFLFRTGKINRASALGLAPEDSFLHRMTGLTYEDGLGKAFHWFAKAYKYETLPDFVEAKRLGTLQIPLCTDALPVWNAFSKYFTSYVDTFYEEDDSVTSDMELAKFWECVDSRGNFGSPWKYGLPRLTRKALVDYLTHLAFNVTAWHEHVGNIITYLLPPNILHSFGFKLRPGIEVADVQALIQSLCIAGITGLRNPKLMSNWKHLLPRNNPRVEKAYNELMVDLQKISEDVDTANATAPCPNRPRICQTFNPKFFETSVSV